MNTHPLLDELCDPRLTRGYGGRFYGAYTALVSDLADPEGQGRVKVRLPWSPDGDGEAYEAWARLATLMAGAERGSWFVPDVDDEVLVCFEAGDPRRPYVVGALWNGSDAPPESMDGAGENAKKTLKSRSGVTITLDDTAGQENLLLETPGGQKVVLHDAPAAIEIVDTSGNSIKLEAAGITINTAGKLTIQANAFELTAPQVTVNGAMTQVAGVLKPDTVITNSVVSTSYSPGGGNTL